MNSQSSHQNACKAQSSADSKLRDVLVQLSAGELDFEARQALIAQILKNPSAAREAKLALRLSDQATQTASIIVQRAELLAAPKRFIWSLRTLAAGSCVGLLMVFALSNQPETSTERSVVSINTATEANDQIMSSSGFEAPDSDFGGSFE